MFQLLHYLGACSQYILPAQMSDSLSLFPVVGGYLLVITALTAIQSGSINRQRQFFLRSCICYWWLIVFWRMESESDTRVNKLKIHLNFTTYMKIKWANGCQKCLVSGPLSFSENRMKHFIHNQCKVKKHIILQLSSKWNQ